MRLSDRPTPPDLIGSEVEPERHRRPLGRSRPFAALAAAVALIALSVGVFTLLASRGHSSAAVTATATAKPSCSPAKATANLPAHASLSAIAPVGTDDGWAVGRVWDPQAATPPATLMLHLQNCQWTPVGTPIPTAELLSVSMASADEGWAVGAYVRRDALSGGPSDTQYEWVADKLLLLHFTDGEWHTAQLPGDSGAVNAKVRMVSPTGGWMLIDRGKRMTIINSTTAVPSYSYTLLHLNGGTWAEVPLSFHTPSMILDDLDAKAPGDCWVVGYNIQSGGGVAAHYANGAWQQWTGAGGQEPTDVFYGVSEVGPNDVWAAGNDHIYHFDGAGWAQIPVAGTGPRFLPQGMMSLQVLASGEGWAFDTEMLRGQDAFHQAALHCHNGQWSWELLSLGSVSATNPISALSGIAMISPTQGWAIALSPQDPGAPSQLAYFDGDTWGLVATKA